MNATTAAAPAAPAAQALDLGAWLSKLDPGTLARDAGALAAQFLPALFLWLLVQLAAEALLWIIVHVLKPLTAKTETNLDDFVIEALPVPVRVSGLLIGVWAFGQAAFPAAQPMGQGWDDLFLTILIASAGMLAAGLAGALVRWYYQEITPHLKSRHGGEALQISKDTFPMARRLIVWAVWLATIGMVLPRFGVDVGPLMAGLGIAGIAVGFALQDTLSNFFSGISLLSDKPVSIGDFVSLENENGVLKGFVEEIGWRSTRIRTRGNLTYFVPNNKLASSVLVNFSRGLDDNWKGSSLSVGVSYDSDPEMVKKVILDAVRSLQKTDSRLGVQEPSARLDEFGDSALVFKAFWTVKDFAQSEAVAGTVREEVFRALRAHGIEIPFPVRTMRWEGPMPKRPAAKKPKRARR
ncbi:Large-conductance mechanosensitive channel MscMJLR [uncultured archaeon]|nr:Large-conductance mechanosensitive channel MscMJLR [uncultured archaeon]